VIGAEPRFDSEFDNRLSFPASCRLMREDRLNRRWELIALGIVVNACLGTVYSWSVFRTPLELVLGMSAGQSGVPYSVFLGAFAFSMPVGGFLILRLGSRLTLLFGGILVGTGWIAAGLADSYLLLTLFYGVVGGAGVGLAYGVPLSVSASWFPHRRGLAMGLTLGGFGVSPFVTAPLAEMLISTRGVQPAMVWLGVGFLVIIGALWWLFETASGEGRGAAETSGDVPTFRMLRTGRFYALWSTYAIGTLAGLTAIGMTASYAQEGLGLSSAAAAIAVSAFGICNGVGRPLFGFLHDRQKTYVAILIAFALVTLGATIAFLADSDRVILFYFGFGILWLMLGGWLAIAPAATVRLFGPAYYTPNYGIMYTAYGVGALAGGFASSALYNLFGSYRPIFLVIVGLCALGSVVAVLFLKSGRGSEVSRTVLM
jgi:MFS transporter, OFA family, oxalate/formate antiporter